MGSDIIVVDADKPYAGVEVLQKGNVYHENVTSISDVTSFGHVLGRNASLLLVVFQYFRFLRSRSVLYEDDGARVPFPSVLAHVVVNFPFQSVYPASLDEFDEVVLGDARSHVSSSVDGKIGTPRQCEIEPDKGRMLVLELQVPELKRIYFRTIRHVEIGYFRHGRPVIIETRMKFLVTLKLLLVEQKVLVHRLRRLRVRQRIQ